MMKFLIIGGTGLLGIALKKEIELRKYQCITISRHNADYIVDIIDTKKILDIITIVKPDVIINACAIVDINYCEKNPNIAYSINAIPNIFLANQSKIDNIKYVYISTDGYYYDDKNYKHDEKYPITLCNEYSKTKYLGEYFSNIYNKQSLVVRTNIIGFKYDVNKPTFLEWCINSLVNKKEMTLFTDFYTSSISTQQFSKSLIDLIIKNATGTYNLASSSVYSKKDFIVNLANGLNLSLNNTKDGLVNDNLDVIRAKSLGLDVTKAETILGYNLPNLNEVIKQIIKEYKNV